jgi:hypothetical protein
LLQQLPNPISKMALELNSVHSQNLGPYQKSDTLHQKNDTSDAVVWDLFIEFKDYLIAQNNRNVRQILCYARKYYSALESGDATILVNLQSAAIRKHA